MFESIEAVEKCLLDQKYISDRRLATVVFLALAMKKPLFLEGAPGVGKTEVASALSRAMNTELIRLQCYEGLDVNHAIYEWNYARQIMAIKLSEQCSENLDGLGTDLFSEKFLIKRPLLKAILFSGHKEPVLLIDEVDRSDEEFEALLLEMLSDFQITIPEIGTLKAEKRPLVILTSNRTRDIHDALKRRCLYHWIDYPSIEKEQLIIQTRVPGISTVLSSQVATFMKRLRTEDLLKKPGVAETLDWATALLVMEKKTLDPDIVEETLGCILKNRQDLLHFKGIWSDSMTRESIFQEIQNLSC